MPPDLISRFGFPDLVNLFTDDNGFIPLWIYSIANACHDFLVRILS